MKLTIAYIRKVFVSPVIYISILGIAVLVYMGMPEIDLNFGVVHAYDVMTELSAYNKLMTVFVSLPFAANFCTEYNCRVCNSILIRTTENKYLFSKFIMCFFTAAFTAFAGIWLCSGIMSLKYPFVNDNALPDGSAIEALCVTGHEYLYLLIKSMILSASLAAWSISGLAMSAVFADPFIAYVSPLVFSYVLEHITVNMNMRTDSHIIPDLYSTSKGYTDISDSWSICFLYLILIFFVLAAIFSAAFVFFAKRRLKK